MLAGFSVHFNSTLSMMGDYTIYSVNKASHYPIYFTLSTYLRRIYYLNSIDPIIGA